MHGPVIQRCLRKLRLLIVAIHFVQIGEVVQLKGIKQRKYGSIDLKMMPISLSVRKGQPVAAVPGRADGIGIVFVLPSFRMVSIHDIFLRFDLNFENPNRAEDCGSLRCRPKSADIGNCICRKRRPAKQVSIIYMGWLFLLHISLLGEHFLRNSPFATQAIE